jgi:hypothetical protein
MHAFAQTAVMDVPDWVVAEMPPGYQNRIAEIRRLSEELEEMSRFARLLWAIGPELRESVRDVFSALKFEAALMDAPSEQALAVRLDAKRHLLLHVSSTEGTIDKKSAEIGQVFRMLHEVAGEHDRVVLVVNGDRMQQPADRTEYLAPEALRMLQRLGANCMTAPTLFKLWSLSGQEPDRARKYVERLYEQDGGTFNLPA